MKSVCLAISFFVFGVFFSVPSYSLEAENNSQVIQAFTTSTEKPQGEHITISDHEKRQVMFLLGAPLLLFILITGGLGVAMGIYGKPVFVAHMIFAGLSVTLAVAHAIVGLVWFYPY